MRRWTNKFTNGKHLLSPIITIIHIPGHWITICILPPNTNSNNNPQGNINYPTLHILDGFNKKHPEIELYFKKWYKDELLRWNKTSATLVTVYRNKRDIEQVDGISCGVSAIIHAYYIIVLNKFFASWNDFSYDHIYDIRMYLVRTL